MAKLLSKEARDKLVNDFFDHLAFATHSTVAYVVTELNSHAAAADEMIAELEELLSDKMPNTATVALMADEAERHERNYKNLREFVERCTRITSNFIWDDAVRLRDKARSLLASIKEGE